jgi:hypothetical protein
LRRTIDTERAVARVLAKVQVFLPGTLCLPRKNKLYEHDQAIKAAKTPVYSRQNRENPAFTRLFFSACRF